MSLKFCKCPYIPCKVRGNCEACVVKSIDEGTLCNCMEDISIKLGAKIEGKPIKTIICDDFEAMSQCSADLICESLKAKPDSLLCLPAGSSATRTFQILKERADSGEVDFSEAYFVALDEWLDLKDESENCTAFMLQNFYNPLNIDKNKIRLFDIHAENLEEECKSVDKYIFDHGGIDMMLLGLGMNGHLGLNEPGESFDSYAKVVTLDTVTQQVGQKYFSKSTDLTRGITLGVRHIFDSKKVILQVGGMAKADIVKKVYESKPSFEIPGTVMQLLDNGVVVLDRDAASSLENVSCE
jgi:glucosamine-6-phosphate isomerase